MYSRNFGESKEEVEEDRILSGRTFNIPDDFGGGPNFINFNEIDARSVEELSPDLRRLLPRAITGFAIQGKQWSKKTLLI